MMEYKEVMQLIEDFFEAHQNTTITAGKGYISIDFRDVLQFDIDWAEYIISNPEDIISLIKIYIDKRYEANVNILIYNLSKIPSYVKRIRDLRTEDENHLISLKGIIRNISDVFSETISIKYTCRHCAEEITFPIRKFSKPTKMPLCHCKTRSWVEVERKKRNCQKIVVEEEIDTIEGTQMPNKIECYLTEYLTNSNIEKFNNLGSRVEIVGVLKERVQDITGYKYIDAISIVHLDEKYKEIAITGEDRQKIEEISKDKDITKKMIKSLARHIWGLDEIKEAMILQLYGSVEMNKSDVNQKYERGNFHILLVGDPSMGKSVLAKSIESVALKSKYSASTSATKTGLTFSIIKDEMTGGFSLQAGAVLLANNGIAIIDEFDKMDDEDKLALHECMTEQTISVDKANIHTQLKCKTAILACANWKHSRFDPNENVYSQINMPDSLISRFDMIFILKDEPNKERDEQMVKLVIGNAEIKEPEIPYELWKKHILYCKSFNPQIDRDIQKKMERFYLDIRNKSAMNSDKFVNITLRQAEAIKRLSIASARLHLRDVTEDDFETAKRLLMFSLREVAFDENTGKIDFDVIETGSSTSEKDIIKKILYNIDEEEKRTGYCTFDFLADTFKEISPEKLEVYIEKIRKSGEIFEPKPTRYKMLK
jgi:replicative DNA helicase Mcm